VTGIADGVTTSGGNGTTASPAPPARIACRATMATTAVRPRRPRPAGRRARQRPAVRRPRQRPADRRPGRRPARRRRWAATPSCSAPRGGNDTIRDFDVANDKLLFDGTAIRSSPGRDWNNDGTADLRINLTAGGSVTLLGLSSLTGVQTGTATEAQMSFRYGAEDIGVSGQHLLGGDQWLVA
jgi:hypothetical protein